MSPAQQHTLTRELTGTRCRCGEYKKRGMSFCRSCYFILPAKARKDLYSRVGEGYEQAYAAACAVLDREQEDAAEVATAAPDIGGPKEKPHAR